MSAPTPPFEMPSDVFEDVVFSRPIIPQAVNRLRGGKGFTRTIGTASINASFTTGDLSRVELLAWEAFFTNLRGAGRSCLLYHALRCTPVSYKSFDGLTRFVGGAFDGTATLDTIISLRELIITGLPADFILRAGDLVGFEENGRRALATIAQDVTGSASGIITLFIEPLLSSLFTTAAVVHFYKPKGEFILDQGSDRVGSYHKDPSVSFTATSRVI